MTSWCFPFPRFLTSTLSPSGTIFSPFLKNSTGALGSFTSTLNTIFSRSTHCLNSRMPFTNWLLSVPGRTERYQEKAS